MKILTAAIVVMAGLAMPASALASDDAMIVYDASGSMWGQIDGVSKIEIARNVMADLVADWSEDTNIGLVAYGHRRQGDCADIETLITPGPLNKKAFISTVNAIQPKGHTPLTAAVQHAAEALSYRDNPATVVLISDGIENCQADPCALSAQLAEQGLKFTTHVIGFDIEVEAHDQLACIAENTGGIFVPAQNAAELHAALAQVQNVMDLQPVAAPESNIAPKIKPELEPQAQDSAEVQIVAPAQAITGASFPVTWSEALNPQDYMVIVPMGAKKQDGHYIRVGKNSEGELRAPSEAGLYEVRYVLQKGSLTLASAPVEVVEADVDITAPQQVTTGASFPVTWSDNIHEQDYMIIVPMGAKKQDGHYIRVGKNSEGQLRAPAEPGLYEVRYVLQEGSRTLASTPVEVVEAEIGIAAPQQVINGASFPVTWSGIIHEQDYMIIVPMGAKKQDGHYIRVGKNFEGELRAPAETGLYEVRYVLQEGSRTLASTPVEVVEAKVTVAGPGKIRAKTPVAVQWTGTVHAQDYIMIVPAGAKKNDGDYIRVGAKTEGEVRGPSEPGLYEIRYILQEGSKMLASDNLEVVAADAPLDDGAGLTVPAQAAVNETITVGWTASPNSRDQRIALARADQADFSWIAAYPANSEGTLAIKLPADTGTYEVRFLDIGSQKILGRSIIEVK